MKIQTDYYGEVEYNQEDLVTINEGFFGFPNLKYYLPICLSEDEGSLIPVSYTHLNCLILGIRGLVKGYLIVIAGFPAGRRILSVGSGGTGPVVRIIRIAGIKFDVHDTLLSFHVSELDSFWCYTYDIGAF